MKILVTGAKGFVGKNLCAQLNNIRAGKAKSYGLGGKDSSLSDSSLSLRMTVEEVFEYDIDSAPEELDSVGCTREWMMEAQHMSREEVIKNADQIIPGVADAVVHSSQELVKEMEIAF